MAMQVLIIIQMAGINFLVIYSPGYYSGGISREKGYPKYEISEAGGHSTSEAIGYLCDSPCTDTVHKYINICRTSKLCMTCCHTP